MMCYRFRVPFLLALIALIVSACKSYEPENMTYYVPDRSFRSFLTENGYAVRVGVKYMRPTESAKNTSYLNCFKKGINSLKGIEMFTSLQYLVCSSNPIVELDLGSLRTLRHLYCNEVPLQMLNLKGCDSLSYLEISEMPLRSLDLSSVPNIDSVFCILMPIDSLDLSKSSRLKVLYCRGTNIRTLDIRSCPLFQTLHALGTPLSTLIVTPAQFVSDSIFVSVEDTVSVVVKPL